MFDIQALAFATDVTCVITFKIGRDSHNRMYPESDTDKPFHPASHMATARNGVHDFQRCKYHVSSCRTSSTS